MADQNQQQGESEQEYEDRLTAVRRGQAFPGGDPYASLDLAKETAQREEAYAKQAEKEGSDRESSQQSAALDTEKAQANQDGGNDAGTGSDAAKETNASAAKAVATPKVDSGPKSDSASKPEIKK